MATVFALIETETEKDGFAKTLGVFDYADITDEKLKEYYGDDMRVLETSYIRDNGLEWGKIMLVNGMTIMITLHYFDMNEIG